MSLVRTDQRRLPRTEWSLASSDPVLTPSSITSKTWPRNVCVTAGSRVKPTSHQRTAMPCARPGWSSTCAAIGPMRRRIGRRRMCWSGKSNCRAAKMVVASITSCRTAAVRNQQSEEESNRQIRLTRYRPHSKNWPEVLNAKT